jgi:predicted phosphodiesterase
MAFAAGRAFAAPHGVFSSGVPRLTFAAVSDIHIKSPKSHLKYDTAVFEHALEWYRAQGVDAVLVAGDLADSGLVEELEMVGAAWRKIFPEDKGQDGRHVEKVFVTGNHDRDAWHYGDFAHSVHPDPADFEAHKLVNDYPRHWKAAFGEEYAPIYMKTVGGFRFVASHWDDGDIKQFGPRLKAFLKARGYSVRA